MNVFGIFQMEWTPVLVFLDDTMLLTQCTALLWCKKHIIGHELHPSENLVEAISHCFQMTENDLRAVVHAQFLNTKAFMYSTIDHWVEVSDFLSTLELLDWYSESGKTVDGLFLWLASVALCIHVNLVHDSNAWTSCAADTVNMMDATIVFTEAGFLSAVLLEQRPDKVALKDDFCDPLTTHSTDVDYPEVLHYPCKDPKS